MADKKKKHSNANQDAAKAAALVAGMKRLAEKRRTFNQLAATTGAPTLAEVIATTNTSSFKKRRQSASLAAPHQNHPAPHQTDHTGATAAVHVQPPVPPLSKVHIAALAAQAQIPIAKLEELRRLVYGKHNKTYEFSPDPPNVSTERRLKQLLPPFFNIRVQKRFAKFEVKLKAMVRTGGRGSASKIAD
ncbi:hypothetical protein CPB83DRAFT_841159 [Crepidotus variabilis]|uniref:Uncharacterized protein n=1 Tax=Crepidotus variabilis TaxID=179855 RepID=A0A9P6JHS9_9AGAR|nr:hypothetical protein CPB83DRAFT_841159 [Crepidotus variabilis]